MKSLVTNDAAMKALRAHCLEIEPESRAAESISAASGGGYDWFYIEPPTHAERHPTGLLNQFSRNEEEVHKERWTRNGKADAAAAAQIAKENGKVAQGGQTLTANELVEAAVSRIRKEYQQRRSRRQQEQLQHQSKTLEDSKTIESMESKKNRKKLKSLVPKSKSKNEVNKQLVNANKEYERACEQNLKELEYGPGCCCHRYPWHYEVLPRKALRGARWGAGKRVKWEGNKLK